MPIWIIEPRDPLIVRDGRPFGPTPGARALTLGFPFPSTTTGAVRTLDGSDADGRFRRAEIPRLRQVEVRGPLLVALDSATGDIMEWLAPPPSDALILDGAPASRARGLLSRLVPLDVPAAVSTNLPEGLSLVGMTRPRPGKPSKGTPRFWRWRQFEQWLLNPQEEELELAEDNGPVLQVRTHVGIQHATRTAAEGALFQTQGLEFTGPATRTRLALAVSTDAPNLRPGLAPLGGERRLVNWRRSNRQFPACPAALRADIIKHRHCRLILLTPGHFGGGWKPDWLLSRRENVLPTLRAVAVSRYQVVSGWDLEWSDGERHGRPKPTRRLAPAGTVLFLALDGSDAAIDRWVDTTWMQCVSDAEQDRRDGFGLAVLGRWDGSLQPMEV